MRVNVFFGFSLIAESRLNLCLFDGNFSAFPPFDVSGFLECLPICLLRPLIISNKPERGGFVLFTYNYAELISLDRL